MSIRALLAVLLLTLTGLSFAAKSDVRAAAASTVHKMHEPLNSCSVVMIAPERALTAAHCTNMAAPVVTINGIEYPVAEAYLNTPRDVAVLIVPGAPCPCARMDPTPVKEGDLVMVVGYPYGILKVVTYGEVQGTAVNPADGQSYVITTAQAAPGMSGGGVFNEQGYLVGTSVAVLGTLLTAYVDVALLEAGGAHRVFGK